MIMSTIHKEDRYHKPLQPNNKETKIHKAKVRMEKKKNIIIVRHKHFSENILSSAEKIKNRSIWNYVIS